ncbi:MAG: hypothetical protein ACFUZC_22745 [Chthoniobacteraceae bacterium]
MPPEPPPLPAAPYVDRKTGLTVFGLLTIGLGVLCALFVAFMFLNVSGNKAANVPPHALLSPALIYGGLAVTFIWLGVGSIMARRWARALLIILSTATAIVGIVTLGFVDILRDKILASLSTGGTALPDSSRGIVFWSALISVALVLVIPPLIWAFFYSRKSVKATCEARSPWECWTDRCPLPVLGAALLLVGSAFCMATTAITSHGVIPFFGTFATGIPGAAIYLVIALLWAYAGWGLYHQRPSAWWLALALFLIFPLSALITYHFHDPMEFYTLAGYGQEQIARLQAMGFSRFNLSWMAVASSLPWVIYLLFIKRYFKAA